MNGSWTWFETWIEGAVDRVLRLDPDAARQLGELEGKVILLELASEGTPLRLYLLPMARGLELRRQHDHQPDVTISGTMSVFLGQLRRGPSVSDALTIRGDIELGQRFQRVLTRLAPDWEEGLARFIGDVPAHQVARFARATRAGLRRTMDVLGQDGAEYLKEEAMILAKRERVADFMRSVDGLRADVDRLEKRLQHLKTNT